MNAVCQRVFAVVLLCLCVSVNAEEWSRFRGVNGQGVAAASDAIPTSWSASANLSWKTELPGPGASSPIVVAGKAFVTCYSGYGLSQEKAGKIENLVRHLVCVDVATGEKLWQQDVKASLPEDPYTGIGVTAHGYASHTPVSDGTNVYAFFGKSGVHAFDLEGNKLWSAEVGQESDPAKWGSASSPIIDRDLLIVTAAAESQSMIGFDTATGKEVWRQEAKGLDNMWGTPALVATADGKRELVMCVAKEIWGMDPTTGKLKWFAKATNAQQSYSSVVTDGERIFAMTGRGGGSVAVDAGGNGDVSKTKTVWEGKDTASFSTPVGHGSKLYSVSRGVMTVVDQSNGKSVTKFRLRGAKQTGGRFGSLDYASPIVVGDRLFYLNGSGQMFVFDLKDELKQVAVNQVTNEKETFWGSPAVSDGKLLLRSSKHLYCVTDKGETVTADEPVVAAAEPEEEAGGRGSRGGGAGAGRPGAGGQGAGRQGAGGGRRFDPISIFNGIDQDKDGKVTEKELEGHRMADRLMTLDKDGDKVISTEEFRAGIGSLFRRGGGGGRAGGGRPGGRGNSNRPDRPQRPEMAGQ